MFELSCVRKLECVAKMRITGSLGDHVPRRSPASGMHRWEKRRRLIGRMDRVSRWLEGVSFCTETLLTQLRERERERRNVEINYNHSRMKIQLR